MGATVFENSEANNERAVAVVLGLSDLLAEQMEVVSPIWANTAKASSQYGESDYSAMRATGPPDVPGCQDSGNAWTPRTNGDGAEWLEVGFREGIKPSGIRVHETSASGFIYQVDLIDAAGTYHKV